MLTDFYSYTYFKNTKLNIRSVGSEIKHDEAKPRALPSALLLLSSCKEHKKLNDYSFPVD
jgi:hypothetical protein